MKPLFLLLIIISFASLKATDRDIVGVWESKFGNNELFTMRFRKDSTFKVFINKKSFTNDGKYTFSDNILTMENDFCKDDMGIPMKGVYKLLFYTVDSFRIEVINDSCKMRREGAENFRFGKVKTE